MKRKLVSWAAGLALLAAMLLPVVFHAHPGSPQPSSPPAPPRVAAAAPAPQRTKEVDEAFRLLEDAKRHLLGGQTEVYGHRRKAVEFIDNALRECKLAAEAHE
jgi:hypothetical protein